MDLEPVASRALHVAQRTRVRLQMDAMPRGRGDPLPLLFFLVPLDVTAGADARRHLGVHLDLLRAIRHPEVELARAGEDRLLMATVAAEGIVLGPGKALE